MSWKYAQVKVGNGKRMKRKVKNKEFLDALKSHYRATRDKSLVTLKLYLDQPLAVADHEGVIESMSKLTQQLSEAEESLKTLETHFE